MEELSPFDFQDISAEDIDLWNRFWSCSADFSFAWLDGNYILTVDWKPPAHRSGSWHGRITAGEVSLEAVLDVSHELIRGHMRHLLAEDPVEGEMELPDQIEEAVGSILLEDLLGELARATGASVHVDSLTFESRPIAEPNGRFGFTLKLLDVQRSRVLAEGVVELERDGMEWLIQLLGDRAMPPAIPIDHVPVRVGIVQGKTVLALEEVTALSAQDIILADEMYEDDRVLLYISDSLQFWGRKREMEITFDARRNTMPDMDKGDMAQEPEESLVPVQEAPVEIRFEVGRKILTVEELSRVRSGYTFALDTPIQKVVTLWVGARRIGHGELVRIGDHVGVRVLELGKDGTI